MVDRDSMGVSSSRLRRFRSPVRKSQPGYPARDTGDASTSGRHARVPSACVAGIGGKRIQDGFCAQGRFGETLRAL
jgi:hypothetical protein